MAEHFEENESSKETGFAALGAIGGFWWLSFALIVVAG